MRALALTAPRRLELVEGEPPIPTVGQALVRVVAAGVCRLDLTQVERGPGGMPTVLGHEACGVVEQIVGPGAGLTVGNRVAIDPVTECGACDRCRSGYPNLCERPSLIGYRGVPGTWRSHLTVAMDRLVPIDGRLDSTTAVLAEPLADVIHLLRRLESPPTGPVAVIGGGIMGLLATALLARPGTWHRIWGVSAAEAPRLTLVEPDAYRRRLGLGLGATSAVHPGDIGVPARSHAVVIEASGADQAPALLFELIAPHGTGLLFGVSASAMAQTAQIIRSEVTLLGSFGFRSSEFRLAVEILEEDPGVAQGLVATCSLEAAPGHVASLADGTGHPPRMVIILDAASR